MPPDFCSRLVESVPRPIRAIIKANGQNVTTYDKARKSDYER